MTNDTSTNTNPNPQDNTYQDFNQQSQPQEYTATQAPYSTPTTPEFTSVPPQSGAAIQTNTQPNQERKKTALYVGIGFLAAAVLITPTTWMIASNAAQNSGASSSQMSMQGGPGGQQMGNGEMQIPSTGSNGSDSSSGSTDSDNSTDSSTPNGSTQTPPQMPGNGTTGSAPSDGSSSSSSSSSSSTTNS